MATILVLVSSQLASAATIDNAGSRQQQAYERAYGHALRCFYATTIRKDEPGSKTSFDAAMKLGRALGYSHRRLHDDLQGDDLHRNVELVEMAKSDNYVQQAFSECVRIGLASAKPRAPVSPR